MRKAGEIADFILDTGDPDSIHFAYHHPNDGLALRYHYDSYMVDFVPALARELTAQAELDSWRESFGSEMLDLFIEQALYLELLQATRALFRRDFAARMGWEWRKPVRIIPALAGLVRASWPGPARDTVVSSPAAAGLRALVRLRRYLLARRAGWNAPPTQHGAWPQSMIAVELGEGIDPGGKNDIFWLADGTVDPARVLLVLERHNLPFLDLEPTLRQARVMGAALVTTDASLAIRHGIPYWSLPVHSASVQSSTALPKRRVGVGRHGHAWLCRTLETGWQRIQYWEAFFRAHNVAAYQHFTELSTETALRRIAAERAGTVEVGRMRSQFFEKSAAAFHFQHQVAMVWNRDVAEVLMASRTGTQHLLETGYVYDYLRQGPVMRAETSDLGFSPEVSVTCVVYDNHSHYDNHFTRQDLNDFYSAVASVAEANPSMGLLVKSKKARILEALPEARARLDELVALGRCVIVSGKADSAAFNALAADIAVGIPGSTAVCEAAMLGCVALMYDPSGADRFAEAVDAGIICRDINAFRSGLASLVSTPVADTAQAAFRQRMAPVVAEGASWRAANFLNACLKQRDKAVPGQSVVTEALQACTGYALTLPPRLVSGRMARAG